MISTLPIGSVFLDRYRILSSLGQGGFGSVYLANDIEIDQKIALKIMVLDEVLAPTSWARFQREGNALCNLRHPHIVGFFRFGKHQDNGCFMVLEHVEGRTLAQIIAEKSLDWKTNVEIGIQVCEAIGYAHSQQIVHRDLKPQNIMIVERDGKPDVRILDFGLAYSLSDTSQRLTETGILLGSTMYMSPESCTGSKVDSRSDIYSLGCVLYECLSGHPPFQADNPVELLYKHRSEKPTSISQELKKQNAPGQLDQIILTTLQKDPTSRFQSMESLSSALQLVRDGRASELTLETIPLSPVGVEKNSRIVFNILVGALVLCLILLLVAVSFKSAHKQLPTVASGKNMPASSASQRAGTQAKASQLATNAANSLQLHKYGVSLSLARRAVQHLLEAAPAEQKTHQYAIADLQILEKLAPVFADNAKRVTELNPFGKANLNGLQQNDDEVLSLSELARLRLLTSILYAGDQEFERSADKLCEAAGYADKSNRGRIRNFAEDEKAIFEKQDFEYSPAYALLDLAIAILKSQEANEPLDTSRQNKITAHSTERDYFKPILMLAYLKCCQGKLAEAERVAAQLQKLSWTEFKESNPGLATDTADYNATHLIVPSAKLLIWIYSKENKLKNAAALQKKCERAFKPIHVPAPGLNIAASHSEKNTDDGLRLVLFDITH